MTFDLQDNPVFRQAITGSDDSTLPKSVWGFRLSTGKGFQGFRSHLIIVVVCALLLIGWDPARTLPFGWLEEIRAPAPRGNVAGV